MALRLNVVAIADGGGKPASQTEVVHSYTVDALLAIALAEKGYKEKSSNSSLDSKTANAGSNNYTKYARDLHNAGYYQASKQGFAWCDMFVDWCFYKLVCNVTGKTGKDARLIANELICVNENQLYGAGCAESRGYYKEKGRLGNLPVKGAQIFFWEAGEVSHTGIVTGFDANQVYTIEGNTNNQVNERAYKRNDSSIVGYGYPKLTGLKVPTGSTVPPDPPSSYGEDTSTENTDSYNGGNSVGGSGSVISYTFDGLKYSDDNPPLYCPQTQSTCWRGTSKNMTIRGVLWHDTGAGNPEIRRYVQPDDNANDREYWINLLGKNQYNNDWNHAERQAGMNCWIGKLADGSVTTVQTMPWNYKPWGCGGACNDGWIQFEICDDVDHGDDPDYFHAAYEEACQITAYLCAKFNLDPLGTVEFKGKQVPVILDHRTSCKLGLGSNHGDVRGWFKKYGKYADEDGMQIVRQDVAALLSKGGNYIPNVRIDDIVTVDPGATAKDGSVAAPWITSKRWKVSNTSSEDEYAILGQREDTASVVLNRAYKKSNLTVVTANGSVTPSPNTGNLTNKERIWNILSSKVKDSNGQTNYFGVAGIMGNMMAESGLRPNNLQNTYEKSLGYSDESYTAAVDNGTYTNFVRDSAGYGLVQWTYWSLKEELLKYAQEHNKSIGDLDMQVTFLCHQLSTGYTSVWNTCCNAKTVKEASDKMLHGFERPYGHDGVNKESQESKRAQFGTDIYNELVNGCSHSETVTRDNCAATCSSDGYTGDEVCSSCGLTVRFGDIIPATGHNYQYGVCTICGATPEQDNGGGGSVPNITNGIVTRDDLIQILSVLKDMLSRES